MEQINVSIIFKRGNEMRHPGLGQSEVGHTEVEYDTVPRPMCRLLRRVSHFPLLLISVTIFPHVNCSNQIQEYQTAAD